MTFTQLRNLCMPLVYYTLLVPLTYLTSVEQLPLPPSCCDINKSHSRHIPLMRDQLSSVTPKAR